MEWKIFSTEWKKNCQNGIWKNRLPYHALRPTVWTAEINGCKQIMTANERIISDPEQGIYLM